MNPRHTRLQGAHRALRSVITAMLLALALAGCSTPMQSLLPATGEPPLIETQIGPHPSAQSWSLYQLYMEARIAMNRDDLATAEHYLILASQKDPSSILLRREKATVQLLDHNAEAAEETLLGILEENPDETESLLILVRIRLGQRRIMEAEELLARVIKADPMREDPYFRLGLIQTSTGRNAEALATYQAMLKVFPYSYAGHYYVGLLLMDQGDVTKAKKHFGEAIAIAPEFIGARMELASVLMDEGLTEEATMHYQRILDEDPTSVRAALALALNHFTAKNDEKALETIALITKRSSTWHSVYTLINRHYLAQGKFTEAKTLLTAMEDQFQVLSEFNYMLGYIYEKLGDMHETTRYFLRISPNSEYYERAILFVSVHQWEEGQQAEAAETLELALKEHPDSIEILTYLASFHEELDNYAEAEGYLLKGISINNENPKLHFRIGVLYDKWGKEEASTASVKKALSLDPEDPNALNFLGYTYARQGIHLEDAERMIKKALAKKPGDGYITDSLGWVYFRQGLFEKALKILRQAAALLPDDPVVLEHLGDALVENNLSQEALESYRRSIEHGHEDIPAIEEKIRLLKQKLSSRHQLPGA